jgi:hypothetical protein
MAHILWWVGVALTPSILAALFLVWRARGGDRGPVKVGRVRTGLRAEVPHSSDECPQQ